MCSWRAFDKTRRQSRVSRVDVKTPWRPFARLGASNGSKKHTNGPFDLTVVKPVLSPL